MVEVNEALTRKVADLARLKLTDHEVKIFTAQLGEILGYVDQLSRVNVSLPGQSSPIEPMTHPLDLLTPYREDIVCPSPTDEKGKPKVIEHAPEVMYDSYKVPPIL